MENVTSATEPANKLSASTGSLSLTDRLLAMANQYRNENNLRQATEIYWTLVENHSGTNQAGAARSVLLELADEYERNNARRMARSIYERLMTLGN